MSSNPDAKKKIDAVSFLFYLIFIFQAKISTASAFHLLNLTTSTAYENLVPLSIANMESLNKVVFDYLRQQNTFYTNQRRIFSNIRSIDSDGYIQTAEMHS